MNPVNFGARLPVVPKGDRYVLYNAAQVKEIDGKSVNGESVTITGMEFKDFNKQHPGTGDAFLNADGGLSIEATISHTGTGPTGFIVETAKEREESKALLRAALGETPAYAFGFRIIPPHVSFGRPRTEIVPFLIPPKESIGKGQDLLGKSLGGEDSRGSKGTEQDISPFDRLGWDTDSLANASRRGDEPPSKKELLSWLDVEYPGEKPPHPGNLEPVEHPSFLRRRPDMLLDMTYEDRRRQEDALWEDPLLRALKFGPEPSLKDKQGGGFDSKPVAPPKRSFLSRLSGIPVLKQIVNLLTGKKD